MKFINFFHYLSANIAGICSPDRPSCPRVVSITGQSVYLEWTAPENDGGSAITGYVLIYGAPDALRVLYSRETITGQITNCTLTGKLYPGRTYQFAVAAENRRGIGLFSDISLTITVCSYSGTCSGLCSFTLTTVLFICFHVSKVSLIIAVVH